VCDVAGGIGTLLAAVLERDASLRGVLVDAAGVLAEAEGYLAARGVGERVELVTGDIFAAVDARADVYLLKDVLHDWDDARCTVILDTVRRAAPENARVVLVETPQQRNRPHPFASLEDLQMSSSPATSRRTGHLSSLRGRRSAQAGPRSARASWIVRTTTRSSSSKTT